MNRPNALLACAFVAAIQMACSIALAFGCTPLGILFSTLAVLCTQHRCWRVVGQSFRAAAQKPNAPSATASVGSIVSPRAWRPRSSYSHDASDSR